MKFDMNQFLQQFENLDAENVAQWPFAVKVVVAIFTAVLVTGFSYSVLISSKISVLEKVTEKEITLKEEYRSKYHVAANLELFKKQMKEAELLFANQLKSLPDSHETPGLLDDITFVGTTSALDFVRLNWQPEITREIYVELPIDIEVVGTYHDFGAFVSKIAGLPRIVTLHNFTINKVKNESDLLTLKLQAKTYRYKEGDE